MRKIVLIDGNALAHRVFHALPPLTTKKGQLVNAIYGFFSVFLKVVKELKPDYIVAVFDLPSPTFRDIEYKDYKAKRPKAPKEIYEQISKIKEILKVFPVSIYEKEGFEADDVIGTIVERVNSLVNKKNKEKIKSIIVTGDLDTLQLVNENTEVYTLKKGVTQSIIYNKETIRERYGLLPEQIVDFKALKGDQSDNIPGVPGIGEKTAIDLLRRFNSLENIYKNVDRIENQKLRAKLLEYKEQAFFSQYLATIRKDVPIEFDLKKCRFDFYNKEKIKEIFENLEFYTLIKRLP